MYFSPDVYDLYINLIFQESEGRQNILRDKVMVTLYSRFCHALWFIDCFSLRWLQRRPLPLNTYIILGNNFRWYNTASSRLRYGNAAQNVQHFTAPSQQHLVAISQLLERQRSFKSHICLTFGLDDESRTEISFLTELF
jgi:hypothetical protein